MIKLIKNLAFTFLLLSNIFSFAYLPSAAFAQNDTLEYPAVAINYLRMDEYKFTPGKPITLSMQVENINSSASEFRYKVQLMPVDVKYLGTSTAQYVLSELPISEKMQLLPKEKKQIDITYNIPSYIDTDVSLQVTTYNGSGIDIGDKEVYLLNSALKDNTALGKALDITSESASKYTSAKQVDIKSVTFTQDDITFVPKGEGSAYLLKPDTDLKISVGVDNQVNTPASLLVDMSNVYSSSSFSVFDYQATQQIDSSKVEIVIPKSAFKTGVYSIKITPIDAQKNELGYSRNVTIGVEGIFALIQAFDLKGSLPAKKGDSITMLANWIPIVQLSKQLTDQNINGDASTTNAGTAVFDARLTLKSKEGVILATKTIPSADFNINTSLDVQSKSDTLVGEIEILVNGQVIAEYQKELLESASPTPDTTTPQSTSYWFYICMFLIIIGVVFVSLYIGLIIKRRRIGAKLMSFIILFAISYASVAPMTTYAAWTQLGASYSFDHLYPEAYDSSSSTWQAGYLNGNATTAWSKSCTKETATSGANSNYVAYTNQPISGNDKMYRGEYIWHKVSTPALIWYTVSKGLSNQNVYPVGPYARTGFIHESLLDRFAKLYDPTNPPSFFNPPETWKYYRPIRSALSSSTGTVLDMANYSNLNQWLQARYTAHRQYTYPVNRDYAGQNALSAFIFGIRQAYPPGTPSTVITSQQMSESGIASTDLITALDAGSFLSPSPIYQQLLSLVGDSSGQFDYITNNQSSYNAASDKMDELNASRPGTYKLFNFLYTTRDEANTYASYDCVSSNMQVFTDTYQVIPNSFIDVVIFNDKNGNGVMDPGEKSISNITNPSGFVPLPGNAPITKDQMFNTTNCSVAALSQNNLVYPNYYESPSSNIAFLDYSYDPSTYAMSNAVAVVTSSDQVITPSYITNDAYLYSPLETPYYWSTISGYGGSNLNNRGFGNPVIYYDSQGKAEMYTGYTGCLNVVRQGVASGAWPDEYNDQVNLYPAPSSITDGTVAYNKIAVNTELSSQYKVKIDTSMLPSGWSPTKTAAAPSYEQTVSVPNPNTNDVVYLGIKYDAPPGQCGTATSTPAIWQPYYNVCASGSVLNGQIRDSGQYYDWSCLNGSLSPTCIQKKCDSGLTYCDSEYACLPSCPVVSNGDGTLTATSTLITKTLLNPNTVRNTSTQCILYWQVKSAQDTPVQCSLDGNALDDGNGGSSISRSSPVGAGKHTLQCNDGSVVQDISTKCFLNASYQEI